MNTPTSPLRSFGSVVRRNTLSPNPDRSAAKEREWSDIPAGPLADACAKRAASLELGYGCVDWFIYIEDASGDADRAPRLAEHS